MIEQKVIEDKDIQNYTLIELGRIYEALAAIKNQNSGNTILVDSQNIDTKIDDIADQIRTVESDTQTEDLIKEEILSIDDKIEKIGSNGDHIAITISLVNSKKRLLNLLRKLENESSPSDKGNISGNTDQPSSELPARLIASKTVEKFKFSDYERSCEIPTKFDKESASRLIVVLWLSVKH